MHFFGVGARGGVGGEEEGGRMGDMGRDGGVGSGKGRSWMGEGGGEEGRGWVGEENSV